MKSDYLKGLAITVAGVVILSPDALLIKITGDMGAFENTLVRSIFMALSWALMVRLWKGGLCEAAALGQQDRPSRRGPARRRPAVLHRGGAHDDGCQHAGDLRRRSGLRGLDRLPRLQGKVRPGEVPGHRGERGGCCDHLRRRSRGGSLYGNAMAVLAALFYALYIVCLRFSKREEVLESLCLSGIIAAAASFPSRISAPSPSNDVTLIAFQSALLLPLGFALYFAGTRYLPAAEVALIGLLETVLGPSGPGRHRRGADGPCAAGWRHRGAGDLRSGPPRPPHAAAKDKAGSHRLSGA